MKAATAIDWPTVTLTEVVTNRFVNASAITHAGDGTGRLFVAQKTGRVSIVKDGQTLAEPFLDLSGIVSLGAERGLAAMAFPPNFATKQYFYACYTKATFPGYSYFMDSFVLSRFQVSVNPNQASVRSEEILARFDADFTGGPQVAAHIGFGPDGFLYIGTMAGPAQDLQSCGGKMLRIDVEGAAKPYGIPAGNPFMGQAKALPEIWAYGLRKPRGFSFDRATGDLYIGDVGGYLQQEIDFQAAGAGGGQNYGWPLMEGREKYAYPEDYNFDALTRPILAYDHSYLEGTFSGARGVTGGYVYRGPDPGRMGGMYLYGDAVAGYIWGLRKVEGVWQSHTLLSPVEGPRVEVRVFGEGETGHLYMADSASGVLYQVTDSGKVWTPDFSPRGGGIPSDTVVITSETPNAAIHYTTDNSAPSVASPMVPADGRIRIPDGATVKARAFRNDLLPSEARTAQFSYQTGAPVFAPESYAQVLSNAVVTLQSETPHATIYMVARNWEGVDVGETNIYGGPLVITNDLSMRAWAVAPGFSTSEISWAQIFLARAEEPTIEPGYGSFTNGTMIRITTSTPNATIYYRVLTDDPEAPFQVYTGPLTLNGTIFIAAYAEAPGHMRSSYRSGQLVANAARPVFDPPAETLFAPQFTISTPTPGATIYYTTNMTGDGHAWDVYTGPVALGTTTRVLAKAVVPGLAESETVGIDYIWPQVQTPTFEPESGPITNGTLVTIGTYPYSHDLPPGLVIRYTVDGSEPNAQSPIYTGPFPVTPPVTVKAAGEAPGYLPGYPANVATVRYGAINFERTFVTTFAGSTYGSVDGPLAKAMFYEPKGIGIDSKGNMFVLDSGSGRLRKITPAGMVTTVGPELGYNQRALCVDAQDNVYVGSQHGVLKFAPNSETPVVVDTVSYVADLSFGFGNRLILGGEQMLKAVAADGSFESFNLGLQPGAHGWGWSAAPAVDTSDNLYFAAIDNPYNSSESIYKVRPGEPAEMLVGGYPVPGDGPFATAGFDGLQFLASDGNGGLLAGSYRRVMRIKDGLVTTLAGDRGTYVVYGFRDGPGNMALLSVGGICVDANGMVYVTDPQNNRIRKIEPDSMGVGLPDGWQQTNFGRLGINPEADADLDGISNINEYWAGTNPNDGASHLTIDVIALPGGSVEIRWPTAPDKRYRVQFSKDLVRWTNLGEEVLGNGSTVTVTDSTIPYRDLNWFYRVAIAQ